MLDIKDRFDKSVQDLLKSNHYLAAEITKLGYPALSNNVPTAGVAWDKNKKKVIFLFNEKFADQLNDEQMAFTVAHEAIHLLNCHVLFLRDEIEKLKTQKKTDSEIYKFVRKMNIAMDCVVNDSLINLYGLNRVFDNSETKIVYGKEIVNVECHDLTAQNVFNLMSEEKGQEGSQNDHESWDSFLNDDGSLNKDFVDSMKEVVDENMENSALSDEEAERLDKIKKNMEKSRDGSAQQAGKSIGNKNRPIDGLTSDLLNWNKILTKFVDDKKQEDDWTRPSKKLMSVYPDVLLPRSKDKEKQSIFIAIDSSGSINKEVLALFVSLIKNTPKHFDIVTISFDVKCYPYDIKGNKEPLGGGGTSFNIIEEYIQENYKKYPKMVMVLTDGFGTKVTPQHSDKWVWLLYGDCCTKYIGNMKYYKIMDVMKRSK